jgi:hypothetical protein
VAVFDVESVLPRVHDVINHMFDAESIFCLRE